MQAVRVSVVFHKKQEDFTGLTVHCSQSIFKQKYNKTKSKYRILKPLLIGQFTFYSQVDYHVLDPDSEFQMKLL